MHRHHKIAYLYFKHLQFIDIMLGHKMNQTFITYIPAINSVKITCFLEILRTLLCKLVDLKKKILSHFKLSALT